MLFLRAATLTLGFGPLLPGTFGLDPGEEGGGGFVVAVFAAGEFGLGGDEFAAEGFGEDRLGQFLGPRRLPLPHEC